MTMHHVLIVDEEEHLLWALEKNLFPERDDISIITANSGERGFELLKDHSVDLLICDIKMPGRVDGFQLILRAKEVAPEARVVIMTAFGTQRIQNFADRIGVTHYIEKPFNVGELRDVILEILDEKEGFQGVLSDLELTDIIQMLCLAKRTTLLHLKHRDHRGKIVFERGEVVHSEFDAVVGQEAVHRMLALRQGDIFMQTDFSIDERTITTSWQDLLLEGMRQSDESHFVEDESDNTDVGMRVSDPALQHAFPEQDTEDSAAFPFFSEQELEEIERASEAVIEEPLSPTVALPAIPASMPTVVAEEDDDFRGPFRAPSTSPFPLATDGAAPNGDGFRRAIDAFVKDCPGLVVTGLISPKEGMGLHFSSTQTHVYDPDTTPVFFSDVISAAERAAKSMAPSNTLKEIQISLGAEHILLRVVEHTAYIHFAVVGKDTSLGVALVLMRRFQRTLHHELA